MMSELPTAVTIARQTHQQTAKHHCYKHHTNSIIITKQSPTPSKTTTTSKPCPSTDNVHVVHNVAAGLDGFSEVI